MLSILVINYKNPALLRLCLKSFKRIVRADFKYEIIVIDIASSIETRNVVNEEFKDIKLVAFDQNIGYTKGVNAGLQASVNDYVFVINPDIIPLEGAVETLYELIKDDPKIGIVGPELLNFDGSHQDSYFRFYSPLTTIYRRSFIGRIGLFKKEVEQFLMHDHDLFKETDADWLMGSAIMVSKKAIKKVGSMDENLFLYMSDVDWARRFWENGYRVIYYPKSKMYHYHRRGSKSRFDVFDALFKKETRWHIKDAIKYFKKYGIRKSNITTRSI
ncbi:MAG: Glycosyl transferase family 2 [Candidatus Yanofskybacteria bacterium GW2011_GWF1_44_227]|uniref:Glycosyl transferase family 2 n=1 Tax=Candidatus Yanofskybacteria bacterium GW2011_GWE2_40_11 TaxID=1619033 RepID=A0A0G0T279_9BACT|nr:MAG: Glycosyl transferase family 2 [Candidatus Yanofskybacteria bacterium GW2011_GWE1_40_10]KKR41195.1 MAG: Glycosyl transferase family 2 [Candidatus Yanofskybacteria bacterium GW2011_GWE2_40_11]KKT15727.1 MAG: Glycosyl transferase family 2 [Candidatus Yanofskybacteria bacterium GW2011_GWF2_43_596]KKT53385.1 MAG: Glycosyl transferase family 2 [Candidatus Yanofskybacteria bacterium GW2011_GWF1_44_227]OGN36202.1 MAG: hypothetical protein A2241_00440 [Candidatus Yanofskybacteria bacterium RIFOX